VKFPTICANCNNARLGARYDPELNRISKTVGQLARSHFQLGFHVPRILSFPVRTHFLMRALIGHLLAAVEPSDRTKPLADYHNGWYSELRGYFLDETLPLPESVRVYYWPYPAQDQVIINGLGLSRTDGSAGIIGDLIKFFPLAYYITDSRLSGTLDGRISLVHGNGCNDLTCEIPLYFTFDRVPPLSWPEIPDSGRYVIMPLDLARFSRERQAKASQKNPHGRTRRRS
jgi:hypothetical protein